MRHLFESWQSLSPEIRAAGHVLLLSDYDGTLVPIARHPAEAALPAGVRDKLRSLAERPAFSIGIISGRSISAVRGMVGLEGVYYAGNHGLEIEGPGVSFVSPPAEAARGVIKQISGRLSAALGGIAGIVLEDKGLSLSVHYRLVAADEESRAEQIFRQVTAPWLNRSKIRVTSGKKVWEVRPPVDWHKGKAVELLRQKLAELLRPKRLLTIFLGDDVTDEDAFRVVHPPQGWGVYVGVENPSSQADYFLESAAEVDELLSRLLALA